MRQVSEPDRWTENERTARLSRQLSRRARDGANVRSLVALVAVMIALTLIAWRARPATAEPPIQHPDLQQVAFMSGCWRGAITNGFMEEYYSTPTSNLIVGVTRYVRSGRTVDFEFSRIEARDSSIVLTPQPRGGTPTPFRLTVADSSSATWENPEHDFPQRILYRREGRDSLIAAIEGPGSSGPRRIEWRMGRVNCDGM
jgi:hypothetical protein